MLNENTIREVANFHSQLNRERETIKERIARINESLTRSDYNTGRYIVLEAQPTPDAVIRDFQNELRACTEGALTGSEDSQYSEAKFLQVKHIIGRFRGREGISEQDRRWAAKVTDVRNWFVFAASERWREDNSEYEHYSDSGGKSGGQKEKLAYTILAASLAYQFGLEWGAVRSRPFRFVVIDEAFGRGSDESAQYGLRLFAQLNLQILIVTPLQKIHIIEPFISSVGFVHNEEGRASKLRNLSIEEYRAEKARITG
ncbi:MAG: SbcC/MukB-like Walker B domain-containing protein [Methylobacter sp.]|nr:SbcC/MukB-like Walker B domain-containing protein [Methylobacter sp.]